MASDNVIFGRVMRMPALDSEWSIEEQTDDQIIFGGEFGHACVKSDGKVISQVPPYVAALEAAIRGDELPVKPKAARSQENKTIMPSNGRKSNVGQMRPVSQAVRDIQVADLTFDDIKTYICPTANDQEVMIFLKLCQARNLNPFLKEAYLVKYDQTKPAQMVVGKDHFTKKAEEHPQFDGYRAGIIVEDDAGYHELEGTFMGSKCKLVGGWAEVCRKDRKIPFKQTVMLREFDKGMANWKTMPGTMIRKCALVQALRECFAADLAGCYDSSEMGLDPEREVKA